MQTISDEEYQLLVDAFGEAPSAEPIIEVQEDPKELTPKQLHVKRMLARQDARIAAEEAKAVIQNAIPEAVAPIVEPIIEPTVEEAVAETIVKYL